MSKEFTVDKMEQYIISILPSSAKLIDFQYDFERFGNTVVKISQNGKKHIFITDRGEIYHNNTMLCDGLNQYKENMDAFTKLIEMIRTTLNK